MKKEYNDFVKEFSNGVFGIKRGLSPSTLATIRQANLFISEYDFPLTVRQIYYRFVGAGLIENSLKSYKRIANILAKGREEKLILYSAITDRTRQAIKPSSWSGIESFLKTVKTAYRKELNKDQINNIEVWVEKDALAGVFEPITAKYDVFLCVGRGYPSHSALYEASKRLKDGRHNHILYFGDFDPSGEDIYRDIQERLEDLFGVYANFQKVSLRLEDIEKYNLPPAPAKRSDSRTNAFVAKNGDVSVELDALLPKILQEKIVSSIESLLDMQLFEGNKLIEREEYEKLEELIEGVEK